MIDFQHIEFLTSLLKSIVKIGRVLGPWPTVIIVGLFLGLVAFLSSELFDLAKYKITKAALAAFSFLRNRVFCRRRAATDPSPLEASWPFRIATIPACCSGSSVW